MDTNHVHTKYAKTSCCPQHSTTQFESRNTDACGYENNVGRVERYVLLCILFQCGYVIHLRGNNRVTCESLVVETRV